MKKFLKRLCLFSFIFLAILILKKAFTPYYLGDTYYKPKLEYFNETYTAEQYNTVCFGSSRIYRHINPQVFDSIIGGTKHKTYNFGSLAAFNPESYFLYQNFVNNLESDKIEYAFLELQALSDLDEKNLKTSKGSYWNNFKYLSYSKDYILDSKMATNKKENLIFKYFKSYLYSFFDVKIFKNFNSTTKTTKRRIGFNGYYALDEDLKKTNGLKGLQNRRDEFLSNTQVLKERKQIAEKTSNLRSTSFNQTHYDHLILMINESKQKGVNLIYVLPPRLTQEEYVELIPIANLLPQKNIIKLNDPVKYKELYMEEYSFDIGHLNAKGATFMTKYLAEEFKRKKCQLKFNIYHH